ncbi:hypothetical protein AUK40_03675 [Candidatus Wirthbacteria bacterium CG2_30_54_11]|uniref:NADH:ubiquinone oxidoreductase 30kDa subunit domain-containing protein n=1 Tax=Candidatus Wirthbacteria bacterium CG2_30_54_11 TaxID=1817892 RepID=A0A1J5IY39_9BACT|nr:MAG: hypothetical protein AUK40_03675 [Candidatus Wirthbacteria bacterium CG2_30_54_11]
MTEDTALALFEKDFQKFNGTLKRWNARQVELTVDAKHLLDVMNVAITDEVHYKFLSTIVGVDLGDKLAVKYLLAHKSEMLVVTVQVPYDGPELPSITVVLPAALLYEREIHDLLGIVFTGHPNLARLVLPDDWKDGVFPLRKNCVMEKDDAGKPTGACLINQA